MYKKVIWATDGSDHAEAALREALRVTSPGGRVFAVHADQRMSGRAAGTPVLADEDELLEAIGQRVQSLESDGVPIELVVRRSHSEPADVVAAVAEEIDADVIVCGTRGQGALAGAVARSFAHRLLHVAHCPMVVVPGVQGVVKTELQAETVAEDSARAPYWGRVERAEAARAASPRFAARRDATSTDLGNRRRGLRHDRDVGRREVRLRPPRPARVTWWP